MNFQFSIFNFQLKRLIFVSPFLFFIFYFSISVEAATLYFSAPSVDFHVNELIPVKVFLDTESETLNAFDIYINYPDDLVSLESVNDANSIINFWVKRDVGVNNGFTGVSVGGFRGSAGLVLQLNFRAKKVGRPVIGFKDHSEARLHDGLGTEAVLNLSRDISLNIIAGNAKVSRPTVPLSVEKKDEKPPEDFSPIVAKSPNAFNNSYFLIFSAQDSDSGIDHYEVQETTSDKPSSDEWIVSSSPYLLKDQELGKYIFVKAVDRGGNEKIVGLKPQFQPYPQWFWWLVIALVILTLLLIVFVIIKIIGRKNKENVQEINNIQQINGNTKLD